MNEFDRTQAMRQRTKDFAKTVIRLFSSLNKKLEEIRILGRQMLRSGTSVGANYREASRSRSDAEFIAKIGLNFSKKSAASSPTESSPSGKKPTNLSAFS